MQFPSAYAALPQVNAKVTGTTVLYVTKPATQRFYPYLLIFEVDSQTGTISSPCTVTVGTNSPTFNDILGQTQLQGLTLLNRRLDIVLTANNFSSFGPGTSISLDIGTAAGGTGTQTIKTIICGIYD